MEETQPEMTRTKTLWYKQRRGEGSPEGGVRGNSTKDLLFHVYDLLPLQTLSTQRKEGAPCGVHGSGDQAIGPYVLPSVLVCHMVKSVYSWANHWQGDGLQVLRRRHRL